MVPKPKGKLKLPRLAKKSTTILYEITLSSHSTRKTYCVNILNLLVHGGKYPPGKHAGPLHTFGFRGLKA
jgi:hypothetical protein